MGNQGFHIDLLRQRLGSGGCLLSGQEHVVPRDGRADGPVRPAWGGVAVLDVDTVAGQGILVSHEPGIDVSERVVAVYRQTLFVGAVRGALGAGLRAESTIEVAPDLAAGFMADREDDPGGGHLRLQISAGG